MTVFLMELREDSRQLTGVDDRMLLIDWHGQLAGLVYSGGTQLHGFNDPSLPVSVHGHLGIASMPRCPWSVHGAVIKVRGGNAVCQSPQPAAVAPVHSAAASSMR